MSNESIIRHIDISLVCLQHPTIHPANSHSNSLLGFVANKRIEIPTAAETRIKAHLARVWVDIELPIGEITVDDALRTAVQSATSSMPHVRVTIGDDVIKFRARGKRDAYRAKNAVSTVLCDAQLAQARAQAHSIHYPAEWALDAHLADDGSVASDALLVPVASDSDEYMDVLAVLTHDGSAPVVERVERVQALRLWAQYEAKRSGVAKTNEGDANEQWLVHGGYSYAAGNGLAQMFVVRVSAGNVDERTSKNTSLKHPDKGYHTVRGPVDDQHFAYMTYDSDLAYPAYLVTYKK